MNVCYKKNRKAKKRTEILRLRKNKVGRTSAKTISKGGKEKVKENETYGKIFGTKRKLHYY